MTEKLECHVCGNGKLDLVQGAFTRPSPHHTYKWPVFKCRTCGVLCTYSTEKVKSPNDDM